MAGFLKGKRLEDAVQEDLGFCSEFGVSNTLGLANLTVCSQRSLYAHVCVELVGGKIRETGHVAIVEQHT